LNVGKICKGVPVENQDVKKVMVIDDMSSITLVLREWLKDAGVSDVITFEDPREAVEEIRKNGVPDFIVTDYNMPGMNGVEFLEKVTAGNDVRAIIMTAYPSEVDFRSTTKTYEVIEKKIGFMDTIVRKIRSSEEKDR